MTKPLRNLLEQHFDTAFAAPDGIKKLRELILTLAMQGKLVEQDPNDPPASELLKRIEAEKQRLHALSSSRKRGSKGVKDLDSHLRGNDGIKTKSLPLIKPEEVPYELPQGWKWVRINEICHDWGQKIPNSKFTYIDVGAIDNKLGAISSNTQILDASDAPSRARKIVKLGTIIYSTVRPYLLNIAILENEYDPEPIASTAFAVLHPFASLNARFIYHYLRSPIFIRYVENTQKGVAYPAINDGDFFKGLFPLPPLSEQHRIVAKIDQLMAKCDELERLRVEREEKRRVVHAAAIRRLLDIPSSFPRRQESSSLEELDPRSPSVRGQACRDGGVSARGWNFIQQHFGELYTIKENVAELRKAILQLAVMGHLVPQDPNDPPASELLKQIETEKQRLHASSSPWKRESRSFNPLDPRFRGNDGIKTKSVPPIKSEEVPYELPEGWEWVTLKDVGYFLGGKTPSKNKPQYWGGNIPWVSPKDMKLLEIQDSEDHVTAAGVGSGLAQIPAQSILMVVRSGILRRAFPVALNCVTCTINQDLKALVPFKDECSGYLLLMLRGFEQFILEKLTKQGVTVESVKFDEFSITKFPFPSLPEQHRIVVKIDQLVALCDTLEQQIDTAIGKQNELLNAVMAQV